MHQNLRTITYTTLGLAFFAGWGWYLFETSSFVIPRDYVLVNGDEGAGGLSDADPISPVWTVAHGSEYEEGAVGKATAQVFRAIEQHYVEPDRFDYDRLFTASIRAVNSKFRERPLRVLLFDKNVASVTETRIEQCLIQLRKSENADSDQIHRCLGEQSEFVPKIFDGALQGSQLVFLLGHTRGHALVMSIADTSRSSASFARISSSLLSWLDMIGLDPGQELFRIYLNAFLHELDPHSSFLSQADYEELRGGTRGQFGGVGVVISDVHGLPFVREIIPNSPAQMAGIEPNDIILRVGDQNVAFQGLGAALRQIRVQSTSGKPVPLWLFRPHSKRIFSTFISREDVPTVSVEGRFIPEAPRVFHLRVTGFSSRTSQEIYDAYMTALKKKKGLIDAMILDLRGNPGGLLDQAIQVSDLFLLDGKIVETRSRYESDVEEATSEQLISLPLVVLINSSSASASEIVAGALKDSGRALLIGEQSFGKGSVQSLFEVADFGALKLTVAHYLTPSGVSIQNQGVLPHVVIRQVQVKPGYYWVSGSSEEKREQDLSHHLVNPTSVVTSASEGLSAASLIWAKTSEAFSEEVFPGHIAFAFPNEENADRLTNPESDSSVRLALRFIEESRRSSQGLWSLPQLSQSVVDTVAQLENRGIGGSKAGSAAEPEGSFFDRRVEQSGGHEPWIFKVEEKPRQDQNPLFELKGRFSHPRVAKRVMESEGRTALVGFAPTGQTQQPSLWYEVPIRWLRNSRSAGSAEQVQRAFAAAQLSYDFAFDFEIPPMFWTAWSALESEADREVDIFVRMSPYEPPTHVVRWRHAQEFAKQFPRWSSDDLEVTIMKAKAEESFQSYDVRLRLTGGLLEGVDSCEVVFVPLIDRSVEIISRHQSSLKSHRCTDAEITLRLPKAAQLPTYGGILGVLLKNQQGFIVGRKAIVELGSDGLAPVSSD